MSGEEKIQVKSKSDLMELAILYFKKEGYKVEHEATALEGYSGIQRKFDLIVQKGRMQQVVWIKDWDRTIGINVVINIDKTSEDVHLSNPILIGKEFSDHARAYANRRKITLLTRRQLIQSLR